MLKQLVFLLTIILNLNIGATKAEPLAKQLIIMADPSLSVALNLIARNYSLQNNIAITTIFEETQKQIINIKEGSPCNIIISARRDLIDSMQQNGLIDVYSRQNIARNNLSLVASKYNNNSEINIDNLQNLNETIIINDAKTAEGFYTNQAIKHYNLAEPFANHSVIASSSFEAIKLIDDYAGIGIIFGSDAKLFENIKEVSTFNSESHDLLIYQAASVIGDDATISKRFIKYLGSKYARNIFQTHGFSPNF
jgi:molybdate transport system substrate-binding protein